MTITEQIKDRLNIIDIISEYIELKPAGANHRALCPFHQEKTPSFMVSASKQIWHCFGCSQGGDIFEFIKRIEGTEFPEALRLLAKKAGIELKKQTPAERVFFQEQQNQQTRLYEIMALAAQFWHLTLIKSKQAQIARDYVKSRKIDNLSLDHFKLGYAVDKWRELGTFLKKRGYNEQEIMESGLIVRSATTNKNATYDRFRGRLMFPIWDIHGQTIGFGGRALENKTDTAKYLNTPQTSIYNKSQVLYGIDKAKMEIRKQDLAIIVEGYMDVIASHQADIRNVVAVSGTALTLEQLRLLKRYTKNLALAFDFDDAGISAAVRSLELAANEEMNIKAVQIPQGKDPDECIRENPAIWRQAIKDIQNFLDYYFKAVCQNLDLTKLEDKKKATQKLLTIIAKIQDPIEQTHYLQKLSQLVSVSEAELRKALEKFQTTNYKSQTNNKSQIQNSKLKINQQAQILQHILSLVWRHPKKFEIIKNLPIEEEASELSQLYKAMLKLYNEKKGLSALGSEFSNLTCQLELLFDKNYSEIEEEEIEQELERLTKRWQQAQVRQRMNKLTQKLRQAETNQDQETAEQTSQEIEQTMREIK